MATIDQSRISRFQKESESWRRVLEYMQQENSYLKNLLADVVNQDINNEMLVEAEDFQNRFIKNDEIIALLRRDIYNFNERLSDHSSKAGMDNEKYYPVQKKLRNEIELLEQQFNKLKFEFLYFISEKI
jgi:hypothetical protein